MSFLSMDKGPESDRLTDNFWLNILFLGVAVGGAVVWSATSGKTVTSAMPLLDWVTVLLAYFIGSLWLSPDLDCKKFRPGHHTFPLGHLKRALGTKSSILQPLWLLHGAVNACWRMYWAPFAAVFTHRGVVHWPIIGTSLKVVYILLTLVYPLTLAISLFLGSRGEYALLDLVKAAPSSVASMGPSEFFWEVVSAVFQFRWVQLFLIGWATADIAHSAGDLYDSLRRGKPFCSQRNAPGLLRRVIFRVH